MKTIFWLTFALLALLWTGGAALLAGLTDWAASVLASGTAVDWAKTAAQWPVPGWIALWADPQAVRFVQDAVLWALGALGTLANGLPLAGQLIGWLVPLVWLGWGLGMVLMLVLTVGLHWWLSRSGRGPGRPGGPANPTGWARSNA
ncbi:MAG: hypothetical protein ACKOD9_12485 [Rubrivivax sp.]